MIVSRETKGSPLTHEELDNNFQACENLKGYDIPTSDIGTDGDYYAKMEKIEAEAETFTFNMNLYSEKDGEINYYYTEANFEIGDSFGGAAIFASSLFDSNANNDDYNIALFPNDDFEFNDDGESHIQILETDFIITESNWHDDTEGFVINDPLIDDIFNDTFSSENNDILSLDVSIIILNITPRVGYVKDGNIWEYANIPMKHNNGHFLNTTLLPEIVGKDSLTIGYQSETQAAYSITSGYKTFVKNDEIIKEFSGEDVTSSSKTMIKFINSTTTIMNEQTAFVDPGNQGFFGGMNDTSIVIWEDLYSDINFNRIGIQVITQKAVIEYIGSDNIIITVPVGTSVVKNDTTLLTIIFDDEPFKDEIMTGASAEGIETKALRAGSHAEGIGTISTNPGMHASGKYNIGTSNDNIFEVGIGTDDSNRLNAFELDTNGRVIAPNLTTALIDNDRSLVTKEYTKEYTNLEVSAMEDKLTITTDAGSLLFTLDNPNVYDTSTFDNFGNSVAISGDKCIVSAYSEDDASGGTNSGKAYIFSTVDGSLLFTLNNPNAYSSSVGDRFGTSVAISDDKCIVSTPYEDDASGTNSGKAYIFSTVDGSLLFTLNNPNAYSSSAGDSFGISVAISDDKCIVGAPFEDETSGSYSGKVYIFSTVDGTLLHTLDNPNAYDTSSGDKFGISVAISGDKCIVGAYSEDDASGNDSGKVYIFSTVDGTLLHTLDNPNAYDTSINDNFGNSVSIDGDKCIVGTPYEDDAGGSDSGKAYIFSTVDGTLLHTLDNPNAYDTSSDDRFGISVVISGDKCIVGAYSEDDASGNDSGKAYIFSTVDGSLLFTLNNPNAYDTSVNDNFGISVAISDDKCIVSTPYEDETSGSSSGKAYIFSTVDDYSILDQAKIYADKLIDNISILAEKTTDIIVVQSLPTPTLANYETSVYVIDNTTEYVCVSNILNPTSDNECFWLQR